MTYCDETLRKMVDEIAYQNELWRDYEEFWGQEGDLDDYAFDFDDEDVSEGNDGSSPMAHLQVDRQGEREIF